MQVILRHGLLGQTRGKFIEFIRLQAYTKGMNPTDTPSQIQPRIFKSGIYWRKSLWNGAKTVPSILAINGDTLSLKSDRETAFEVPVQSAKVHYTKFGTMVIKADGKKFDITGVGAAISRPFTEQQKEELANKNVNTAQNLTAGGLGVNAFGVAAGGVGGAGMSIAGNIQSIAGFAIGVKELNKWKPIFTEAGIYKG